MQPQINAIKQLLETNNAIAATIESILVNLSGESASWEQSSTCDSPDKVTSVQVNDFLKSVVTPLWRSRIDLNDARINAEEVNLEEFLSLIEDHNHRKSILYSWLESQPPNVKLSATGVIPISTTDILKKATSNSINSELLKKLEQRDRKIDELQSQAKVDRLTIAERDREIDLLKSAVTSTITNLNSLRQKHYECGGDSWYSCAKSDSCASDQKLDDGRCDCGADEHNQKIDQAIALLESTVSNALNDAHDRPTNSAVGIPSFNSELPFNISVLHKMIGERDHEIANLRDELQTRDRHVVELTENVNSLRESSRDRINLIAERDRQIEELKTTVNKHREQFENLRSRFQVTLKAIAMNLNSLRGERKPDRIEEVDGVKIVYRSFDTPRAEATGIPDSARQLTK